MIRVGLLVDKEITRWQYEAVRKALDESPASISLVVVNDVETDDESHQPTKRFGSSDFYRFAELFRNKGAWAFVLATRKIVRNIEGYDPYWTNTINISDCEWVQDSEIIYTEPQPSRSDNLSQTGHSYDWMTLSDDVVSTIAENCDVVVRFGFGLIEGNVLDAPEHGVLSYHPADIRKYRGAAREQIVDDLSIAGATLQRLDSSVDGGEIIVYEECDIRDLCHRELISERIYGLQANMLSTAINRLQDPSFTPEQPDELGEYVSLDRRNKFTYCARIILKEIACTVKNLLR